jgi:general stress protein YciG
MNGVNYYTYAYLREDKTPYYIGKGTENRIYSTNRRVKLPKDKSRIIFLKQNLTEEEAFKHERYMINVFGRKDLGTGILRNMTDGGDGASNWGTPEQRSETARKGNASRTPEQRREIVRKGRASMTPEQRSETARKANASRTPEQRSEILRKGRASMTSERRSEISRKANASRTPEQRSEISRKGGNQKFQCTETGFITNAGCLARYQKARGIDTSKRVRLDQ